MFNLDNLLGDFYCGDLGVGVSNILRDETKGKDYMCVFHNLTNTFLYISLQCCGIGSVLYCTGV